MFLPILSPEAGTILAIAVGTFFIVTVVKNSSKKIEVSSILKKSAADTDVINYSEKINFEIEVKEVPGKFIIRNTFISKDLKFCCTLQNKLTNSYKTLKEDSKASLEMAATIQIDIWKQAERAEAIMRG